MKNNGLSRPWAFPPVGHFALSSSGDAAAMIQSPYHWPDPLHAVPTARLSIVSFLRKGCRFNP